MIPPKQRVILTIAKLVWIWRGENYLRNFSNWMYRDNWKRTTVGVITPNWRIFGSPIFSERARKGAHRYKIHHQVDPKDEISAPVDTPQRNDQSGPKCQNLMYLSGPKTDKMPTKALKQLEHCWAWRGEAWGCTNWGQKSAVRCIYIHLTAFSRLWAQTLKVYIYTL